LGSAPLTIRCATRCARVLVLPDPAPAMTSSGPATFPLHARQRRAAPHSGRRDNHARMLADRANRERSGSCSGMNPVSVSFAIRDVAKKAFDFLIGAEGATIAILQEDAGAKYLIRY